MPIETTYRNAKNNLASLLDQVTNEGEIVVIKRRGRKGVALIAASELSRIIESIDQAIMKATRKVKRR